ncbi:MAG: MBL fold metallo-hydrolase, partial [Oscillospiraceae bacterium]
MKIDTLSVGMIGTNCYVIATETGSAVLIDPGADPQRILNFIETHQITVKAIILTHGHFDHMSAVDEIKKRWDVPVYIHPQDREMLQNPVHNASFDFGRSCRCTSDQLMEHGDILSIDTLSIRVIHTPGHTEGSVCLVVEDAIFTGDTIFCGSIGRTDLYGGSYPKIAESAKKIAAMKRNYRLFPG